MSSVDLELVIPVFNERDAIVEVVREFQDLFSRLGTEYRIMIFDDGSTDDTLEVLRRELGDQTRIEILTRENRGHGPTILEGYRRAGARWVAQADGDGEIPAEDFERLWLARDDHDFLVGRRDSGSRGPVRRFVSFVARTLMRLLWASTIRDANVPFRIMRRERFDPLWRILPDDFLTPNLALSGMACRSGLRVFEAPVRFEPRTTGRGSLRAFRIFSFATKAFLQNVRFGVTARKRLGRD